MAVSRGKNKVQLAENDLELLKDFTYKRQIKQLQSDVNQAEMALARARAKSRADVIQAKADLKAKEQESRASEGQAEPNCMDQISQGRSSMPLPTVWRSTRRRPNAVDGATIASPWTSALRCTSGRS